MNIPIARDFITLTINIDFKIKKLFIKILNWNILLIKISNSFNLIKIESFKTTKNLSIFLIQINNMTAGRNLKESSVQNKQRYEQFKESS